MSKRKWNAGWEKGVHRAHSLYVLEEFHEAAGKLAGVLGVSMGVVAERALLLLMDVLPSNDLVHEALLAVKPMRRHTDQHDETIALVRSIAERERNRIVHWLRQLGPGDHAWGATLTDDDIDLVKNLTIAIERGVHA